MPEPGASAGEDPWIGRVVDRRYRVLSRVGEGGMGLVYKVEHIQLGKIAAMKVLHADTARDAEAVRRFRTEAQAVSRLDHPHIVQTFDFGQSDGALYLVMELLKGDDLATVVKRDGPLPFEQAVPIFIQICSALTEAHEAGIIHRDLKPENIVVVTRREGTPHAKVLDFGLAKLHERADGAEITSGGQVVGTPYYMSPEQVRSEPLDVRTDVYSLGATLYRVLTGTPPFQAPTPVGVLTKHITDPLELPRLRAPNLHLPPEADAIVSRAMAKARDDRYPTIAHVQRDLEAALARVRRSSAATVAPAGRVPEQRARSVVADAPTLVEGASVDRVSTARAATDRPSDSGNDGERLRRREFDAFEQSLRRRKLLSSVVLPALLLVAVGAGIWAITRVREKASSSEREPNDTPAQATLLPLDAPVQGRVGKRIDDARPDMDYFRIPVAKTARIVSARLEGIPNVDLVLELFDGAGASVGKSDSHGVGGGEWLQPTPVGPGEAYVLVRQIWIQGTALVEDVPDPYRLSVHWGPIPAGWELEPNDGPERANAVDPGRTVRGYLASADDKDWFAFTASRAGRLVGRVSPPAGVEIVATIDQAGAEARPTVRKLPRPADIEVPVVAGQRVLVGLARRVPTTGEPKSWGMVGLDDPYELALELRPSVP